MTRPNDSVSLDRLHEAALIIDPRANRVLYANPAAHALLQRDAGALGATAVSALFGDELPELVAFTQSVLASGRAWTNRLGCQRQGGERLSVEISAARLDEPDDSRLLLILHDRVQLDRLREASDADDYVRRGILEWRRIEGIFQDIERENQLLLKAVGEGIYGVNVDGLTTFVNPAAEAMLGWSAEELVGRNIHSLIHHSHSNGDPYPAESCPIYAAFHDGLVHKVHDEVFFRRDGAAIHVEYTSTPVKDHDRLIGAVVVFRDVSERREAQARLEEALHEVERLKKRLEMENAYLLEELSTDHHCGEIVGQSAATGRIAHQVEVVAPTDANVLISGESGTGKELIARAIHQNSARRDRPLIRVNCAAIPRDLFESEFFGHTSGAFTGATADRVGRFELADGGTLFLDEVGEIPLELQGKLLRVLQEGQFEKVGESRTRAVDVRIIAATNRNLVEAVERREFREDLYFRLNVFPIESLPLRQRREDIPLLAMHFVNKAAGAQNRPGLHLSQSDMQQLVDYDWPGNVRELENIIERAIILSRGDRLVIELPKSSTSNPACGPTPVAVTASSQLLSAEQLKRVEVDSIRYALHRTGGKVFGADGAAALLGLKPTTLASRLKRLDIDRREFAQPSRTQTVD
ncbi:MAG: sigma 54-interacting transcriptional regulator [Pseudomonadota bacterium]|nr:sigma 54-interacting transcriptional regulator [Pseudomonadota bacterium]